MNEVDIEGVKIQFKNMTMFTWSTTVKTLRTDVLRFNFTGFLLVFHM